MPEQYAGWSRGQHLLQYLHRAPERIPVCVSKRRIGLSERHARGRELFTALRAERGLGLLTRKPTTAASKFWQVLDTQGLSRTSSGHPRTLSGALVRGPESKFWKQVLDTQELSQTHWSEGQNPQLIPIGISVMAID